jgi:Na+-driven multidrug efflux pump
LELVIFQHYGIKGAALSTIIGQFFGMIIGLIFVFKNKIINLSDIFELKLNKEIIKNIYKVGFPTIVLEAISSFITLILNKILIGFSDAAVSVWGIYCGLQKFIMIIIYGLNYGMIPIIAYNYGAKLKSRVEECISFFVKLAIGVTLIGAIVFIVSPQLLISMYDTSEEVFELAISAFRILGCGFCFAGVSLVLAAVFQAFGNGVYSLIVNLSRKIIFVIPLIFILKGIIGIYSVWIAFVIAEIIAMIIAIYLFRKINKNIIQKI